MLTPAIPAQALCADATGDGHVTATDALAALVVSVQSGYQARLDVSPVEKFDGRVSATDALVILVATAARVVPPCAAADRNKAIVTTASCDFATGGIAEISTHDLSVGQRRIGTVDADSVVRVQHDRVFIINRFDGSSVQEIDASAGLETLWRCSVGAGSNPHDIALAATDKMYVSRYDATSLAIVDPSAGKSCENFLVASIDLSAWADADGIPEMDQMLLIGDRLFVAIQRLDRNNFFRPAEPGALIVIDTLKDSVIGVVELELTNPSAETKGLTYDAVTDRILVGGPGTLFTDLDDGGIEAVDPHELVSSGILIRGSDLGGDLGDFALLGSTRGYAIVANEGFVASVLEFDLDSRAVGKALVTSPLQLSDVEVTEDGKVWVVDRDCFNPGVRVFAAGDNSEITPAPVYPDLTPFTIDFSR